LHTLSVSALNEQIKTLLEGTFEHVFVEGELSRITFHNSGHIYFTLKDRDSSLRAVMFRGNASKLKFQLKEGLKVILDGAITLYKPRGEYQINCFSIEPAGHGALALAYEQLKAKLSQQGYFNPEIKKVLPRFPKKIALITSATGAALQDMLRVANSRYRDVVIDVYDVLVQGVNASFEISNAIIVADAKEYDIIVVSRGGGSIEDLWAFNEERVADAIYFAKTPIVSAVGHEIDWLISDFVADVRAATPSAAMQMILPDENELFQTLDSLSAQFTQILHQKIYNKKEALEHLKASYVRHSVEKKTQMKLEEITAMQATFMQRFQFNLERFRREVVELERRFPQAMQSSLATAQSKINTLSRTFEANNPKLKSKKGFAQISQSGKVIDIESLEKGELFEAQSAKVTIMAEVKSKKSL